MNTHTQSTPENVKARLTLDVTCLLNGEAASEILARLQRMWVRAIGERLLIDETAAKVDVWSIEVTELPSATNSDALEAEIAAFMQQRIGDGNLCAEDIPLRLASYGLMAPEDFIDEMRERMGMEDDAPTGRAVIPSTEPADGGEIEMQVAVVCIGASGSPNVPVFKVRSPRRNTTWVSTTTRPGTWPKRPGTKGRSSASTPPNMAPSCRPPANLASFRRSSWSI